MVTSWAAEVVPGERRLVRLDPAGGVGRRIGFEVERLSGADGAVSIALVVRVHPVPVGTVKDPAHLQGAWDAVRDGVESYLNGDSTGSVVLPGGVGLRVKVEPAFQLADSHQQVRIAGSRQDGQDGTWSPDADPRVLAASVAAWLGISPAGALTGGSGPLLDAAGLQLIMDLIVGRWARPVEDELRQGWVEADADPGHDAARLKHAMLPESLARHVSRDMSVFDAGADDAVPPTRDADGSLSDAWVRQALERAETAGAQAVSAPDLGMGRSSELANRFGAAYPEPVSSTAPGVQETRRGSTGPWAEIDLGIESEAGGGPVPRVFVDPGEPEQQRDRRIAAVREAVTLVRAAGYSDRQLGTLEFYLPRSPENRSTQYHWPNRIVLGPGLHRAEPESTGVALGEHHDLAQAMRDEHVFQIVAAIGRILALHEHPETWFDLRDTRFLPESAMIARNVSLRAATPGEAPGELFVKLVAGFPLSADEDELFRELGGVPPEYDRLRGDTGRNPAHLDRKTVDVLAGAVTDRLGGQVNQDTIRTEYAYLDRGRQSLNINGLA